MASSIAILVPEPTEKCAVCAASPRRTRLRCDQERLLHVPEVGPLAVVHQERVALELFGEDLLHELLGVGVADARCGGRSVEVSSPAARQVASSVSTMKECSPSPYGIGVRGEGAERGPDKREGHHLERRPGAEPDVLAGARLVPGAETVGEGASGGGVGAVGRHHQVVPVDQRESVGPLLETELGPRVGGLLLEDGEQRLAGRWR